MTILVIKVLSANLPTSKSMWHMEKSIIFGNMLIITIIFHSIKVFIIRIMLYAWLTL